PRRRGRRVAGAARDHARRARGRGEQKYREPVHCEILLGSGAACSRAPPRSAQRLCNGSTNTMAQRTAPRGLRVFRAVLFAVAAQHAAASSAFAQLTAYPDPYDVPRAPRPPTLPELTHAEMEATLEETAAAILQPAGGGATHAYVQRIALEVPLAHRRWYVGA